MRFFLFLALAFNLFAATPVLKNKDCAKCHNTTSNHKVLCTNCHKGHPPRTKIVTKNCTECHKEKAHFSLSNCTSCHVDPHDALKLVLKGNIKKPCLTCHEDLKTLSENKTEHLGFLSCTKCHPSHKGTVSCVSCHESHSEEMESESCTECHMGHLPRKIKISSKVPNYYCEPCHGEEARELSTKGGRHGDLSCVFCHGSKHRSIPSCSRCHPEPHPKEMVEAFPSCSECHESAHGVGR